MCWCWARALLPRRWLMSVSILSFSPSSSPTKSGSSAGSRRCWPLKPSTSAETDRKARRSFQSRLTRTQSNHSTRADTRAQGCAKLQMLPFDTILFDVGGVLLTNGWDHRERASVIAQFALDLAAFEARHPEPNDKWER